MVKVPSNLFHTCQKRLCLQSTAHTIVGVQMTVGNLYYQTKQVKFLDNPDCTVFTFLEKYKLPLLKEYIKTKHVC